MRLRVFGNHAGVDLHPADGGEAQRVRHQVEHDLADAHRVEQQPGCKLRVDLQTQRQAFAARRLAQCVHRLQQHAVQIGALGVNGQLAGVALRQVEQVVDELGQHGGTALGQGHQFVALCAFGLAAQVIECADDGVDRRANFVAGCRDEVLTGARQ